MSGSLALALAMEGEGLETRLEKAFFCVPHSSAVHAGGANGRGLVATAIYKYHVRQSGRPTPPPQGPLSRSYIFLVRKLDETDGAQGGISDHARHERLVMCAWTA